MADTYVRDGAKNHFIAMTKEEILAAIEQAISTGTIGNVDTGFITTIREMNKQQGLKFWVGTTAEFNALETKENNCLYIKTDDTSPTDIENAIAAVEAALETHEKVTAETGTTNASTALGHVRLTDNILSTNTGGWAVTPTATTNFFNNFFEPLRTKVTNLEETALVPVGGIACGNTTDAADFAESIGYGTWLYLGQLQPTGGDVSSAQVHFFQRSN